METADKQIIKINASAGSGKTHNLKERFLKLLAHAHLEVLPEKTAFNKSYLRPFESNQNTFDTFRSSNKNIQRTAQSQRYNFSEILALTFTNAAASEMQNRIIVSLKEIALGQGKDTNNTWTEERAKKAIEQIFTQYNALNIKTIDSLLHQIVRLCALELEISPQFEVTFDNKSVINPIFKEFAQKAREDEQLSKLFDAVCISIIEYKKPFIKFLMAESVADDCAKIVETRILEKTKLLSRAKTEQNPYYSKIQELSQELEKEGLASLEYLWTEIEALIEKLHASEAGFNEASNKLHSIEKTCFFEEPFTSKEELQTMYAEAQECMVLSAKSMLVCIEEEELAVIANFYNATQSIAGGIYKESTYLQKENFNDCLKAVSKNKASENAKKSYRELCENCNTFNIMNIIFPKALMSLPLLELAIKMEEKIWEFEKEHGIILSDRMPSLVSKALHDEHYISAAYCRMGANLTHILFDEFQDTSTAQWQALEGIAKEALSQGSVFFVGDVKQAIYGWRGGDASLFERAPKRLEKCYADTHYEDIQFNDNQTQAKYIENKYIEDTILKENWRSDANIIEWNNRFFSNFNEKHLENAFEESFLLDSKKLIAKIPHLKHEIEESYQNCLTKMSSSYKSVKQEVPENRKDLARQGIVQIHNLNVPSDKVNLSILALIAPCVHALHYQHKYDWKDICILTITNKQASLVAELLLSQGIAVVSQGSLLMAEHPLIQEIIACMRFLANPMDEQAFFEVLSSDLLLPIKIDRKTLLDFAVAKRKNLLFSSFKSKFPDAWNNLFKALLDNAGLLTAYDSLCEMFNRFNIRERHKESEVFLLRLLEIVHRTEENKCLDLSTFLDYWDCIAQEEKAPLPKDTGAVSVMTVHKAKGLEFKAVLMPWVNFTVKPDIETPQKIQYTYKGKPLHLFSTLLKEHGKPYYDAYFDKVIESINTLYVAWTRAEKELHVFLPYEAPTRDGVFPKFLDAMLYELYYENETISESKKGLFKSKHPFAQTLTNENDITQNIKLEKFDDYMHFGTRLDKEKNEIPVKSLINPDYLRVLEFLFEKEDEENSQHNTNSIQHYIPQTQISLSAFIEYGQNINKEELINAKSTDNAYYAKQINYFFGKTIQKIKQDISNKKRDTHEEVYMQAHAQANRVHNNYNEELIAPDQWQKLPLITQERPMSWLPRLKIFRSDLNDLYLNQESKINANKRGTLMHKCLENIVYSGDIENDAKRAVHAVFGTITNITQTQQIHTYQSIDKKEFIDAITWFLGLKEPFGGTKEWLQYSLKEHALASKEGKMFRVDVLVNRPKYMRQEYDTIELIAIDYKTGYNTKDENGKLLDLPDKHNVVQIKNYLSLLKESLSTNSTREQCPDESKVLSSVVEENAKRVLGMLIYLDRKEIHFVDA